MKDKLKGYSTSRGTIRYTEDKPLPEDILKEIISLRLKEITSGE